MILILIFGILEWWVSFLVIHHNITQIKLYKYASWKNAHIKHKSIIFDHPGDVFPGLCITISHSRGKIYAQIYAQLHRNNIFTTQNKWRTFMKSCNLIIVLKNINNYKTVNRLSISAIKHIWKTGKLNHCTPTKDKKRWRHRVYYIYVVSLRMATNILHVVIKFLFILLTLIKL